MYGNLAILCYGNSPSAAPPPNSEFMITEAGRGGDSMVLEDGMSKMITES